MEFETAFDVAQAGYRYWWLPTAGLLPLVVGALMAFAPQTAPRVLGTHVKGRAARFFGFVFVFGSLAWMVLSFMDTWNDYRFHRNTLQKGEFRTIEGRVVNFRPLPASGRGFESFEVNGLRFHYEPDALAAGYNRAAAKGGRIAEGAYVRIAYINLAILRVEIGKR